MALTALDTTADETLVCCQCERSFTFSVQEKKVHARRGYSNKPKRCPTCRENRRNGTQSKPMSESEILLETCKAIGELRVFMERKMASIEQRLDSIEEALRGE